MKKQLLKFLLSLTALIFAVSCGNSANSSTNPDTDYPTGNYFYVAEDSYTLGNKHDIIEVDTDASYSQVKKEAKYKFSINPSDANCSVKIGNITIKGTGTITDVILSASDLSVPSYIKNGDEVSVSLTSSGINKFKASPKTQKAVYTVTLEFKNGEASKTVDIDITVIPVKIITKTEIENMVKGIQDAAHPQGNYGMTGNGDGGFTVVLFDLTGFTLSSSGYNANGNDKSPYNVKNLKPSPITLGNLIEETETYKNIKGLTIDTLNAQSSVEGKTCTYTYKFKLSSGYALDSSSSFITTTGMKIKLTLNDSGSSWQI